MIDLTTEGTENTEERAKLCELSGLRGLLAFTPDKNRGASGRDARARADLEGTVYGLMPDHEYQVLQAFTDYYGHTFELGERLHFKQRHFLPYHGGHTILFAERPLYLQEDQNSGILEDFSAYIAPVEQ